MNFLYQSYRGLNHIWRYIIGFVAVLIAYILGQLPVLVARIIQLERHSDIGTVELAEFDRTMNFEILHISRNGGFILLLLMFIVGMLCLYMVVNFLHKKAFQDIVTSRKNIDWRRVATGFGLWLSITIILEYITYLVHPENYAWRDGVTFESFVGLIFISLSLLFIQTSFEELYFRGYVMQGLAFHVRKPWISILVSSVLFASMHMANPEIEEYGFAPMVMYYIMAAVFLALITVVDDGQELALGIHWATNFFGAVFLTYKGAVIQTDTIFLTTHINVYLLILTFLIGASIMYLICHKIYKWPHISVIDRELDFEKQKSFAAENTLD
jgi:membrane protease YdiL (CAAX protease family)